MRVLPRGRPLLAALLLVLGLQLVPSSAGARTTGTPASTSAAAAHVSIHPARASRPNRAGKKAHKGATASKRRRHKPVKHLKRVKKRVSHHKRAAKKTGSSASKGLPGSALALLSPSALADGSRPSLVGAMAHPGTTSTAGGTASPPASAAAVSSSDPFVGQTLYVDPNSTALATQRQLTAEGRSTEAALIGKIASQPVARWFGNWSYGHGGTAGDVSSWVGSATAAHTLPVLVAYDIPWRDCSQYSSGGAANATAYRQFIDAMNQGIAGRRAVVIVEPDALAELECLTTENQNTYYSLLSYAVSQLGANPLVSVYLDAGNAHWQSASTMAARLRRAGVAGARGFSLNVSNFDATASENGYGDQISAALGTGSHYLVDTGRNGQGRPAGGEWCNPPGRGLGVRPTAATSDPLADAYIWVKQPGNSDGSCNGAPAAGQFWTAYALGLAQHAAF